jgi:hypothetical protein
MSKRRDVERLAQAAVDTLIMAAKDPASQMPSPRRDRPHRRLHHSVQKELLHGGFASAYMGHIASIKAAGAL